MNLDATQSVDRAASGIEQTAQHKGAREAIVKACRVLRAHGHRESADLLLENAERITEPEAS